MGEKQQRKLHLHAIMICMPYQGHLNPFVNLALKLASKGFTITFAHLQFLHRKLCNTHNGNKTHVDLFAEARQSGLDIRFTTIADPFPLEFDRDLHFDEYWESLLLNFPALVDAFVADIIHSHPDMLHFLVTDTIFHWPSLIALKHNLVNVALWTQPALVFSLAYHWDLLQQNGHFPCKDAVVEEIKYIPGVDSISTKDLMKYVKESESGRVVTKGTRLAFENVKKADFIVHNTVEELEFETLSSLNNYQPNYAIGPLNFSQTLPTYKLNTSFWSQSDCSSWLQSKPSRSVLYVSFGSLVQIDRHVIEELSHGLILSEVNFVWVVRQGMLSDGETGGDVLPSGFHDEIKDRGLVVGWCDQIKLLSDPAIGGFLTHCGWNSIVESMWFGVPMICYPIYFEQPCNRKLVVDDWKIGIDLCEGATPSLDRNDVAQKIRRFMNGDDSERLRQSAGRVKQIMQSALQNNGSSVINFEKFVKDLEAKIYKNTPIPNIDSC